jgi:hemerythrin-like domain-containing protein
MKVPLNSDKCHHYKEQNYLWQSLTSDIHYCPINCNIKHDAFQIKNTFK